ncbi:MULTISPECIES: flagellar hook-associated protein FlgL [Methylomicrobium]|uniref:Flagellar hook-associated protein 3 n=1 Tax=Methylomicrobium album BG8 TaxID=686340 RepID=H8GNG4_METAL|nr:MULTISPECIES: flagellar hook-associated protein FlgL [Methylomicrobium]EIC29557.1 flagellar hook-associated protein 3 [Methylomicrobium album BG8]
MRISTSWAQQLSLNSILNQQVRLSQTQMQLSSGKKILAPSDDPAAAARVVDLNQNLNQTEQYQRNIDTARQRLSLQDGLLQNAVDIFQQINELGIQGLNDTNSPSDRNAIATEMEGLKDQLVAIANSRNANGEYVFAGFKSDTQPFEKVPAPGGGYAYGGDGNQRQIQIGTDRLVADGNPGESVFGVPTGAPPPAGPSPGIDNAFEAIDKFIADLKSNAPESSSLDDIKQSMERIINVQSSIGVRLNVLDQQENMHADQVLNIQTVLSGIEDVDYADAISRFSLQSTALQAAQQAFVQVQKLSLFNLF